MFITSCLLGICHRLPLPFSLSLGSGKGNTLKLTDLQPDYSGFKPQLCWATWAW